MGGITCIYRLENNFLACGFWDPNPADLKRIRQEIDIDGVNTVLFCNNKTFKSVWGELQGEAVKTAPKGYAKDHPDIDLLRLKQHIFTIKYDGYLPTRFLLPIRLYKPYAPLWII